MTVHSLIGLTGVALGLGVAVATGAVASADAIDDAWPYGVPVGTPPYALSFGTTLPGFSDLSTATEDGFTYLHSVGGAPWYTVDDSTYTIPSLISDDHQVVQTIIDATSDYPSVGTVADYTELFPIDTSFAGVIPLIASYSLDDPDLGFAWSIGFPGLANTFISDDAGIKDIGNVFGQTFTLFEFPAADLDAS